MIRRSKLAPPRRPGGVAVVVTLGLIPLLGVLAFCLDIGLLMAARKRAQTVADAAAHAAACQLYVNVAADSTGLDKSGKAQAAARLNATANGYSNDGTTNTVIVNIPPQTPTGQPTDPFAGKAFHAEVRVTVVQPRFFAALFGSSSFIIGARAVARGATGAPAPYTTASIVALNPTKSGALSITGGVNLTADSPVQVDSASGSAMTVNNGVNVTAPTYQIVGGYSKALGSNLFGSVVTGAPTIADPLAPLVAPDPSTLAVRSFTSTYGIATLSPGVYNGGLTLGGGMIITLSPGIYYMKGGNFTVANGVNLSGTGVTIYLDTGTTLNLQGGTNFSITPPTTGTYAGLSVFENRTSTTALNFANGSNVNIGGTVYAASAPLIIAGGANVHVGSQVIVDSFALSNGVNLAFTTVSDTAKGFVAMTAGTPSIAIVE